MIVRAKESLGLTVNGMPKVVQKGEPFDDSEPVVVQNKWAFESDVERGKRK